MTNIKPTTPDASTEIQYSPVRSNVNPNNLNQSQSDAGRCEETTDIISALAEQRKRRHESIRRSRGGSDLRSFVKIIKEAELVRVDV